ncbi:uncharacterized protein LOC144641451 isoform X2 [Oculina patagonica]
MASAVNLESNKTSSEMENKTSDDYTTCLLCKDCECTRKGSENPVHAWLKMDTIAREKHLKHMKICILAPVLFGKRMNYSSKNIRWLRHLSLVPRPSFDRISCLGSCLSKRLIELAELAEEIVDTVLSCLSSDKFLHSSYHTYKELKDCAVVEEALSIGNSSEFVSLMSSCFSGNHHLLDKQGIQLLSLTILHQVFKYICQACEPRDCLTKFEEEMKMKEPVCTELRLKGNDHFMDGDYHMAAAFYSRAIKLSPFDPLLYGNRAQSFLKLKKFWQALSDAKRAVYLNPEWEKGHYRFAQAYFELGFPEKAMAVNSLAQKCCPSTLDLLRQAVVFKREIEASAVRNTTPCCSSSAEQTSDRSHRHHQACGNPCSPITKVGSKRNWKIANEESETHGTASPSAADKDTPRHPLNLRDHENADKEDNYCDTCSIKDDGSDCELSDHDSLPPLIYSDDSSDNDNDEDMLCSGDSIMSSLPSLASLSDSDTESDINLDSDDQPPTGWDGDNFGCSDPDCTVCNDHDYNDDDDDELDLDLESDDDDDHDDDDNDDDDSDEDDDGDDDEDLLRTLMLPPFLNGEASSFTGFVLGVLHGFFTAHPEMMNEGTPPALPEVIESLPTVKVTKDQLASSLSCAICQCDYELDEAVLELPCSHLFHPPCVTTWLKMHATCPTCRDVLPH